MHTLIWATCHIAGVHHWPAAPERVQFLAVPHRHIMVIRAERRVEGLDREEEFLTLGQAVSQEVRRLYPASPWLGLIDFGSDSVEMIATKLVEALGLSACEVSEDGENGCRVEA